MMNNKVALHTLGCKLNYSETSTIGSQFIRNGYRLVDFDETADVYLINTCTVTENADRECRQIVRRALRNNPNAYVIITGCYAQLQPGQLAEIEGVDLILGSNEKFNLFSFAENFEKRNLACIYVSPLSELNEFGAAHSTDADSRTRAFLKIQDGCDYKCSFCTIPQARGLSRSLNPQEIARQFNELIDGGYKEVVLTGVNVGDYGSKIDYNLYNLLLRLTEIPGEFRIRISSIEPNLLSNEILELAASSGKLCNHFHIPLQSGNNKILKLMQRRYRKEEYQELIFKAKSLIKNLGIGVDVIVGFPGETETDFMETYNFLLNLPIAYLHVFTYSERPNTKAASLPLSVDVVERKRRNKMLRLLSRKKREEFYRSVIGQELNVLFESRSEEGLIKGFSSNYVRVAHPHNHDLENEFIRIKADDFSNEYCSGTIQEIKKSIDSVAS